MNAKAMLAALHARFPISAETCGKDFHGTHSIILNEHGQVQLNVWVMTPVGLRTFPTTVAEDEMVGEPKALALEIEKAVKAWAQANPKGEKVAITLNGEAVTLDSTELTYEKVVQLAHPEAQNVVYTVTYGYRGKGGDGGILHPGEKVTAVHGMIVNCCFTGNA